VRDILDDPEVIELISENLDPDTWCPKQAKPIINKNDENAIIGEKDSGYLYAMGIDLHCPSDKPKEVLPLPVILHMDATHCGRSGANQLFNSFPAIKFWREIHTFIFLIIT
jgi:hypothetical protein